MITRRSLLAVLTGAIAAPIIVRPGLIMPIRPLRFDPEIGSVVPSFIDSSGKIWRAGETVMIRGFKYLVTAEHAPIGRDCFDYDDPSWRAELA